MSDGEIEHWGGVEATSELIVQLAQVLVTYAKMRDMAGVGREAGSIFAATATIVRFIIRHQYSKADR